MANLGVFFKTLGTKIATLWKTTTWFKISSIGGAVVIATSAVVIPNAVISETGGIFHKCDFSIECSDTAYSAANCTEKAKYYYSCACGKKGTELFEYGNALGHDLTHHESKQVTCTDIGFDAYDTCSRCDYTTYIEIPATGHTDGDWITDANATCTENGSKHQVCSVCNDTINTVVITATGHTGGNWITDTNATCTQNGSKHQVCSVCNDTIKTAVIPATGHTGGNWITDTNATCTEDGGKHQICSVCNDTIETAIIPATGHTDGEWITDAEATCTEDGSKHQICSVCEVTLENEILNKFGHNYKEFLPDNACVAESIVYQCQNCDDTYSTQIRTISADIDYCYWSYTDSWCFVQDVVSINGIQGGYGKYNVKITYTDPTRQSYTYMYTNVTDLNTTKYLGSSSWNAEYRQTFPPFVTIEIEDELGFKTTYTAYLPTLASENYTEGYNLYSEDTVINVKTEEDVKHIYTNKISTISPTNTQPGRVEKYCDYCNGLEIETIEAIRIDELSISCSSTGQYTFVSGGCYFEFMSYLNISGISGGYGPYTVSVSILDLTSNTSKNLLYGTFDNNINESMVTFTGSKYQAGSSYSSLPSPSKNDIPATILFTISIYDSTGLSAQYWGYINDDNPNNINVTSSPYLQ